MKTTPQIIDKYGRVHDYLRISLTERCNLRCFYCMPEEGAPLKEKSKFMSSSEVVEIAKAFVSLGIKKIRLTGGEPLIKKGVDEIIRELGKLPIELAITTNAVIVDQFIDVLKEAGVKSVNVSLDSLDESRFKEITRRDYYTRVRDNIDLLVENDFHVKVNMVVIRGANDDEVVDFVEWTKSSPIHVQFIEFMPFDGNNWNWEKKVSHEEIFQLINEHYGADCLLKIEDHPNDTARNYKLIDSVGNFGIISSVTNPFCDTCNRIRLTADGKIKNCLFSQSETDLLTLHRANKDLESTIRGAITTKSEKRGGHDDFNDESVKEMKNRAMVTIGG